MGRQWIDDVESGKLVPIPDSNDFRTRGPQGPKGDPGASGEQLPDKTGTSGKFLMSQGESAPPVWAVAAAARTFYVDTAAEDLGAAINALDAAAGAWPATIVVPDSPTGEYNFATHVALSNHRVLRLGSATYANNIPAGSALFEMNRGQFVSIIGQGPSTVIKEHTDPTGDGSLYNYMFARYTDQYDATNIAYGDALFADFTISGTGLNYAGNGTSQTFALANAKRIDFRGVRLDSTHAIGIGIGGSIQLTISGPPGDFAEDVSIIGCRFINVSTQNIGAVNFRGLRIIGNEFRGGPLSQGTYIDIETNDGDGHCENFIIANNTIDVGRDSVGDGTAGNTWGIFVQQGTDDPLEGQCGPGLIIGNTIMGDSGGVSLATAIEVNHCRDVSVIANYVRESNTILLDTCTRCDVSGNRVQASGGGGNPGIWLANTTHTDVYGNRLIWTPGTYASNSPGIAETGGSDYNNFWDNKLTFGDGTGTFNPVVTVVGAHSRSKGNIKANNANHDNSTTWDVELADGVAVRCNGSGFGTALVHNGYQYAPKNVATSDNKVHVWMPSSVPSSMASPIWEWGTVVQADEPVEVSALRFFKVAGDALSTHTLRIYDADNNIGDGPLCEVASTDETASGWQRVALGTPFILVKGKKYAVTLVLTGSNNAAYFDLTGTPTVNRPPFTIIAGAVDNATVAGVQPFNSTSATNTPAVGFEAVVGDVASYNVEELVIADTSAIDLVDVATPREGNYLVAAYYRVVTAPTDVTITVTWTDGSGSEQSLNIETVSGATVGSHSVASRLINVQPLGPLKIKLTASVADNVIASATVILL